MGLELYSSLRYKQSLVTNGRIILVDEPLAPQIRKELRSLATTDGEELLFLDDSELASDMEELLSDFLGRNRETLLVFPGNGSNYPYKLSQICHQTSGTGVYAKRFWQPGEDPVITTGLILPEIFLFTQVETVVVVDDVISSGLTMQKLREHNAWRFTKAKWVGVSWITQMPQRKAKSGINGYEQVLTACVVGKTNGARVPVNSISTLRQSREIAQSYALRHFREPETFLDLISR